MTDNKVFPFEMDLDAMIMIMENNNETFATVPTTTKTTKDKNMEIQEADDDSESTEDGRKTLADSTVKKQTSLTMDLYKNIVTMDDTEYKTFNVMPTTNKNKNDVEKADSEEADDRL